MLRILRVHWQAGVLLGRARASDTVQSPPWVSDDNLTRTSSGDAVDGRAQRQIRGLFLNFRSQSAEPNHNRQIDCTKFDERTIRYILTCIEAVRHDHLDSILSRVSAKAMPCLHLWRRHR